MPRVLGAQEAAAWEPAARTGGRVLSPDEAALYEADTSGGSAGGGNAPVQMPPQGETIFGAAAREARNVGPGLAGAMGAVEAGAPLIAASGPAAPLTTAALGTAGYTAASLAAEQAGIREQPSGDLWERAKQAAKEGLLNELAGLGLKGVGKGLELVTKKAPLYEAAAEGAQRGGAAAGVGFTPAEQGSRVAQELEGVAHSVPYAGRPAVEGPKAAAMEKLVAKGNETVGATPGRAQLAGDLENEVGQYMSGKSEQFKAAEDAMQRFARPPASYMSEMQQMSNAVALARKKVSPIMLQKIEPELARIEKGIQDVAGTDASGKFVENLTDAERYTRLRDLRREIGAIAHGEGMHAVSGQAKAEVFQPLYDVARRAQLKSVGKQSGALDKLLEQEASHIEWKGVANAANLPGETKILTMFRNNPERFNALAEAAPQTASKIANTYLKEAWEKAVPQAAPGASKVRQSGFRSRLAQATNDIPESVRKYLPGDKVQLLKDLTDAMEIKAAVPAANRSGTARGVTGLAAAGGLLAIAPGLGGLLLTDAAINNETAGAAYRWLATAPLAQAVKNRLAQAIEAGARIGAIEAGRRLEPSETSIPDQRGM